MTLLLVLVTGVVSYLAFQRTELFYRLMFNPFQILQRREWYRLLSHGLVHADWVHLMVNMFVLWSFGQFVENRFQAMEAIGKIGSARFTFLLFYASALVVSSLLTLYKHRNHYQYNSVGASGAVSAMVFCSILFEPSQLIYLFAILPIPGWLFGFSYLAYSWYMGKKESDYINHDAHFVGAVYGLLFPLLLQPSLAGELLQRILP